MSMNILVPMKLTNLVLHECQIEIVEHDTQRRSLRRYTQHDPEALKAMIYVPIYGCAFDFIYRWFALKEPASPLQLSNNVLRALVSWFVRYSDHTICANSLLSSLQFAECHEPYYHCLPTTFKLSRILIRFIPVMHIVRRAGDYSVCWL